MMKFSNWLVFVSLLLLCGSFSAAQTRFSLVFNEGFGSIKVGDINTTLVSLNSIYDVLRNAEPETVVGEYLPLPTRYRDWQTEIRWKFWRRLSLGISVSGPSHFSQKSALTDTFFNIGNSGSQQTMNTVLTSDIHVSPPIGFNLCYSLPTISRINLIVTGGISYHRARFEQTRSWVFHTPSDTSIIGREDIDVSGHGIGGHGGIALEYIFNRRISLIAAGDLRLAKIRTFDGHESIHQDVFDGYGGILTLYHIDVAWEGILYHYIGDSDYINARNEKITVSSSPPEVGIDNPFGVRKAFLDLGGFTFRIGVKIGLF